MSAELESHTLTVPNARDQQIWCRSDLGLQREKFYAAFYAIHILQRQQQAEIKIDVEESVENLFLDRLALLFARVKTDSTKTPANVTATSLVRLESCWKVYIAKNDGLQDGNAVSPESEKVFAKRLQNWIREEAYDEPSLEEVDDLNALPHQPEPMFIQMAKFWKDRINYYTEESITAWEAIGPATRTNVEAYFQERDKKFSKERFDGDWERAAELVTYLQNRTANTVNVAITTELLQKFHRFWKREGREDWHKPVESDLAEARNFRKCIRYMELLGMPVSTWNACVRFRKLPNYKPLHLIPIEKPTFAESRLDKDNIAQILKWWKTKTRLIDMSRPLANLQNMDIEPELFFHCELQILMMLTQLYPRTGHYFIGCSKLSCESCWVILRGNEQFTTRGSHHKVSANCAFPFPSDFESIGRNMREMQSAWRRTIFSNSINLSHLPLDDTDQARTQWNATDGTLAIDLVESLILKRHSADTNPYTIDWHIKPNQGSFASVYSASKGTQALGNAPSPFNTSYALKVMSITTPAKRDMVRNEIQHLRSLQEHTHPNILRLEEAFYLESSRTIVLATRPYAPLSLDKFFKKTLNYDHEQWYRPRQLEPWPKVIGGCLKGLEFLHTQEPQILHLDLKPHNILLWEIKDSAGNVEIRPIIADFGVSTELPIADATQQQGTPEYMSPEMLPTPQSDVWALGCCFAQIFVLLGSGEKAAAELLETIRSPDRLGFSKNLKKVKSMLRQINANNQADDELKVFIRFREIVSKMLDENPRWRETTQDVLAEYQELEAHLEAMKLGIPEITVCLKSGLSIFRTHFDGPNLPSIGDILFFSDSWANDQLSMKYTSLWRLIIRKSAPRVVFLTLSNDKKNVTHLADDFPSTTSSKRSRSNQNGPIQAHEQPRVSPTLLTAQRSLDGEIKKIWEEINVNASMPSWRLSVQVFKDMSTLSQAWRKAGRSPKGTIRQCALEIRYNYNFTFIIILVFILYGLWILGADSQGRTVGFLNIFGPFIVMAIGHKVLKFTSRR